MARSDLSRDGGEGALEQTIYAVLPEIPEGDIDVDVASDDGYALVVSEVDSGGVGHLERLVIEIGNGQERFDAAFEAALRSCENDRLSGVILSAAERSKKSTSDISTAFDQVRSAVSFRHLDSARHSLVKSLSECGLASDRSAVSAVVSKLLRPGSSRATDLWVRALGRRRAKLSQRIGISLDQRVFAYWCMQTPAMTKRMHDYLRQIGRRDPTPDQLINAFIQLTFVGCSDSCPECLGVRREMEGIVPSRWLAQRWVDVDSIDFHIDAEQSLEWHAILADALRDARRIKLTFSDAQRAEIAERLSALLAEEHDRGYIFSPFTTASVERTAKQWQITLQPSGQVVG